MVVLLAAQGARASTVDAGTLLARRIVWPLNNLGGEAHTVDDLKNLLPLVGTLPAGFTSTRADQHYPG